jgi:hypothetical protein
MHITLSKINRAIHVFIDNIENIMCIFLNYILLANKEITFIRNSFVFNFEFILNISKHYDELYFVFCILYFLVYIIIFHYVFNN